MSTCPTNDIHSIYIDGELPLNYREEYESHVANCKICAKKLEQVRKIQGFFLADRKTICLDDCFVDESFRRLSTKLRYAKNVSTSENVHKFPGIKVVGYGAAAAVVLMAFAVPLKLMGNKQLDSRSSVSSAVEISALVRPHETGPITRNVVVNGTVSDRYIHNVSANNIGRRPGGDVDIFRPEFSGTNNIRFNFNMMGFEQNEINARIRLPEKTISGQLQ